MKYNLFFLFIIVLSASSCQKYLDEKPDKKLAVPATLRDLQALMDDHAKHNRTSPSYGETSADDYYLTDADYNALIQDGDRATYVWGDEIIFERVPNGWYDAYYSVNTMNVVLESVEKILPSAGSLSAWDNVKGSALFYRGRSFFEIAAIWTKAYDPASANTDLGIPLRLASDFNIPSTRSTVEQTFSQIITDLETSVPLLPENPPHVMRPSRAAAYALLARVNLYMRNYTRAKEYASLALNIKNELIDFNTLSTTASFPIARFSKEVIFHSLLAGASPISPLTAKVDSVLIASYTTNDLRRQVFYKNGTGGTTVFKGSYDGSNAHFNGLTTAELYLIRAEAYAREGMIPQALADLNTLLQKRWKTATYIPLTATTQDQLLAKIILERRKELPFRTIRWLDIKRLNREGAAIVLKRKLNGQEYILERNSNKYALPIPDVIIKMTGMQQNAR